MMKLKKSIIYIVAFILQLSLMNLFTILGVAPNLMLCLVFIINYLYDDGIDTIWVPMVLGVLIDLVTMNCIGISSLGYLLVFVFAYIVRSQLSTENRLTLIPAGIIMSAIFYLSRWFLLFLLGSPLKLVLVLEHIGIISVWNVILLQIIYTFMAKKAFIMNRKY